MRSVQKADLPQGSGVGPAISIGVKGVDAVVFGGDKDDVVRSAGLRRARARGYARQIERLRVDVAVDRGRKELSKSGGVHVGGRENCFIGVCTGSGDVVMLGEHA